MGTLGLGKYEVEILENGVRNLGGKTAVSLIVADERGDEGEVLIFVTPKSAKMARAQLKVCGFNVDNYPIEVLDSEKDLLKGHRIPVIAETYNGRVSIKVNMQGPPPKSAMESATAMLREAKKGEETFEDTPPTPDDDECPF